MILIFYRMLKKSIVLFFISQQVFSAEFYEFYTNARSLGMGGASLAVTNDETALLLNPAALGKLRNYYGTVFDPEIDISKRTLDSSKSNPLQTYYSLDTAKKITDANRETYYHSRGQVFPSFVAKYFGIGVLYSDRLDAEMNAAGDKMMVDYRNDIALVSGLSAKFFDGRIKIGGNAKFISRHEIKKAEVDPTTSLAVKDIGVEGVGLSIDGGILLTAPWTYLPTIGAVVRDIGGTQFKQRKGIRTFKSDENPETQKQQIDVAMALFPIHSSRLRSSWTVEYKDVSNVRKEDDSAKKMHVGYELNYGDVLFFRAGYHQRYYTLGAELASEYIQWQLASYGEEIGTKDQTKEDRRYVIKFAFRF